MRLNKITKITKGKRRRGILVFLLVIMLIGGSYSWLIQRGSYMSYQEFLEKVNNGNVKEIEMSETKLKFQADGVHYYTENPETDTFKEEMLLKDIRVKNSSLGNMGMMFTETVGLLLMAAMFLYFKKMTGGKSNQYEVVKESNVSFRDVVGMEELKKELLVIADMLKNGEKYRKSGIRTPRGILLEGPPGNGKTLLAKAFAKEAGVGFIQTNASDFGGIIVGKGANEIRAVFKQARQSAPCIIFIDEFDSIGEARRNAKGSGDADDTKSITTLLHEMDGFKENEGIFVIAATNRANALDKALIRPGRFDKKYMVNLPEYEARVKLVKVYLKNKRVTEEVDSGELAYKFSGFSCAQIESILNESAIISMSAGKSAIDNEDIDDAVAKEVLRGNIRKEGHNKEDIKTVSYHEAGHAIAGYYLTHQIISRISVLPTTSGVGGVTMGYEKEKRSLLTIREMKHEVIKLLGGRGAEYILVGKDEEKVTGGAANDLDRASDLVDCIIKMSSDGMAFNFDYGEAGEKERLESAKQLFQILWKETIECLEKNWEDVEKVALELMEKEVMDKKRFEEIVAQK